MSLLLEDLDVTTREDKLKEVGKMSVQIYRASLKSVRNRKQKVGQIANAAILLFDLRRNMNLKCYLGIAFDSNTGLSVLLI